MCDIATSTDLFQDDAETNRGTMARMKIGKWEIREKYAQAYKKGCKAAKTQA